ncbi:hypothetical protein ACIBF4_19250 [Rhodococcus coprophilus]|uniref:hypothetical protein n=1 Tax=Rhodococcus coprophilus TaxID=38310 RepID=UPI0037918FF3
MPSSVTPPRYIALLAPALFEKAPIVRRLYKGASRLFPRREESDDWATIVGAYDRLLELSGSPVVAVNRAVAVGFRDEWEAGLAELEATGNEATARYLRRRLDEVALSIAREGM